MRNEMCDFYFGVLHPVARILSRLLEEQLLGVLDEMCDV
jgi:hypothetical protein